MAIPLGSDTYRLQIEAAAREWHLDPDLVQAVVEVESGGRFHAYRYEPAFYHRYLEGRAAWAGCRPMEISASYGLMQVMYTTAVGLGFTGQPWELFNPAVSLYYGCKLLARLLAWAQETPTDEATQLASTLAAYNGGKRGNAPDSEPDRNADYASKVLAVLTRIQQQRAQRDGVHV